MEEKHKEKILSGVANAYFEWHKKIRPFDRRDDIDEVIPHICAQRAFGVIITSGRENPTCYIGTFKQCSRLKEKFGGRIDIIEHWWFWLGFASVEQINKLIRQEKKNYIIRIPPQDLSQMILEIGHEISDDIKYGSAEGPRVGYVGCWRICSLLKAQFGGKMGQKGNSWYWIGHSTFSKVRDVCDKYRSSARRYKKKEIVI